MDIKHQLQVDLRLRRLIHLRFSIILIHIRRLYRLRIQQSQVSLTQGLSLRLLPLILNMEHQYSSSNLCNISSKHKWDKEDHCQTNHHSSRIICRLQASRLLNHTTTDRFNHNLVKPMLVNLSTAEFLLLLPHLDSSRHHPHPRSITNPIERVHYLLCREEQTLLCPFLLSSLHSKMQWVQRLQIILGEVEVEGLDCHYLRCQTLLVRFNLLFILVLLRLQRLLFQVLRHH